MNKISVVIPTLNEGENITPLIERIDRALRSHRIKYELIFIDDHSTDNTRQVIEGLNHVYPIRLFLKQGKTGKAYSLLEGFSHATYDTICIIDADLQYPPEAIPKMLSLLQNGSDIVIANRTTQQTSIGRQLVSRGFNWLFAKLLHGIDGDSQSGLKLFKKEIIERLSLTPSPWTFDLEFLIKARQAGYKLSSININFSKRQFGQSKIRLIRASLEIGLNALLLKFKKPELISFHPQVEKRRGQGFHYKGAEFVFHTDLTSRDNAFFRTTRLQRLLITLILAVILLGFSINWHATLVAFIGLITGLYFLDLLFNLFLVCRSFSKKPEIQVTADEIAQVKNSSWPTYTIFCPLYKEWQVIPQFVKAMSTLDYPKNKLQVMLLLEENDSETRQKIQEYKLPRYFKVVIVPHSFPKTKPKACNYGLMQARGEYAVIFDAEDIPETDQLKKAVLAFQKSDQNTACIQAKLNFYNPEQNILTRLFTAEYSLWFDLVLSGLQSIKAPIPLGGTSNHFRIKDLRKLGGWDPFNVTEDCDLGILLAKQGYHTQVVDSTTFEEANSQIRNWFPQRTRWIKGYIQTYLVHMKNPQLFFQGGGKRNLFIFQLIVGGKVLSMFINPIMWTITLTYFALRPFIGSFIESFFPPSIIYMAIFSLTFGNFLYLYYYMMGAAKRQQYNLINYTLLVPFYWLAMSIAAWRAVIDLIRRPHYWAKTTHGLHLSYPNLSLNLPVMTHHQPDTEFVYVRNP